MQSDKKVMPRILSPKVDVIFKLLFGDIRNVHLLTNFLQAVLKLPDDDYEEITITDPHLKRETMEDKMSVLDVKLTTKTGKIVNIEIQIAEQEEMPERATYYNAKALVTQIHSGQDYSALKNTISIIITDFVMVKNSPRYHHVFRLYDKQSGVKFTDLIEINTLELNKMPEKTDNTDKYDWMQFLNADREEEFEMIAEKNPVIGRAYAELKRLSQDEEAQLLYEAREKAIRDENSRMKTASNKGRLEGRLEGELIGELKTKLEVAKTLLGLGDSFDRITVVTGLSAEEIKKLSDEIKA